MRCKNCIHYDVCYQYDITDEDENEMCALYESKRPHGEWKFEPTKGAFCSECGWHSIWNFNFCPNCGALMRKEGDPKCGE